LLDPASIDGHKTELARHKKAVCQDEGGDTKQP
jgi:hypothetical protein